jgi:hypothetical protein
VESGSPAATNRALSAAPDDDPEFLRGLNRNRQQPGNDEG